MVGVSRVSVPPDYTYFYRGTEYWKFDNQKLTVEAGYPKNILRDWMGCDQSEVEGRRGDRQLTLDDVDITVTVGGTAIAVVIPSTLSLCILVLVYTVFQFHHKRAQPHKYPVQEWV